MPASQKPRLRTPTVAASCDDVRRQLVFEPGELVAQQELAFLQSLQLQLVGLIGPAQRLDRRVEIAMLLAQSLDASDEGGAFLGRGPLVIHPHATLSTRPDYGGAAPAAQGVNWSLTRRRQKAPTYHEIVKILRSVVVVRPELPPKCGDKIQEFEGRGSILPLARSAGYVTISSS
jgi:hypothetical protein